MKVFIFGASGYLGSNLVNYLQDKHEVYALVRSSSSLERLNCEQSKIIKGVEDNAKLNFVFSELKPDLIINTVALYGRSGEAADELVYANIYFPVMLYELCKKHAVSGFINTGTSLPDNVSTYASTKNIFVDLANTLLIKNLKFVNIALEHFYGPDDDASKFTSYVINTCRENEELNLTTGKQKRDFIYIYDVLTAYETIINNLKDIDNGEEIPLGSGSAPTVRKFVEMVREFSGSTSVMNFGAKPDRANELMYSCADISRLKELDWEPNYSAVEGLKSLFNVINKNK